MTNRQPPDSTLSGPMLEEADPRATLRHDLRTPINQILGYSELLMEEAQDDGRDTEDLKKIKIAAGRLLKTMEGAFEDWPAAAVQDPGPEPVQRNEIDEQAAPSEAAGPRQDRIAAIPGARLLVVDDEAENRDILSRRLSREGYEVLTAPDGAAALKRLDGGRIDLVLLDILMPGLSGLEVLALIRKERELGDLPIIMATADHESGTIVEALGLGANDYVTKPLDLPVVLARVTTQLQLKEARAEVKRLAEALEVRNRELRVEQLVRAYRERGHVLAELDPLGLRQTGTHSELTRAHYDLDGADPAEEYTIGYGGGRMTGTLGRILAEVRRTYCGSVGVQYMHIDDLAVQRWLRERIEDPAHQTELSRHEQLRILHKLTDAEVFETFLQTTFAKAKRFSLEGAETLLPLLDQAIERAGECGVDEVVIGMPHRGRLNVLANVAQVIIDEFVASAEEKWHRSNGIVLLLPHGFEGQGPEHSSARPERFLQLAAGENMEVTYLSTASQVYHRLRRQALLAPRRPLIAFTPKMMLQHPSAASPLSCLVEGDYQEVLPDAAPPEAPPERVLLCSGQLHTALMRERRRREAPVVILRVEQLHPFPVRVLQEMLSSYPENLPVIWVQDEPANMGAWSHVRHQLESLLGNPGRLHPVTRPAAAAPATGSRAVHERQHGELIEAAFGDPNSSA